MTLSKSIIDITSPDAKIIIVPVRLKYSYNLETTTIPKIPPTLADRRDFLNA